MIYSIIPVNVGRCIDLMRVSMVLQYNVCEFAHKTHSIEIVATIPFGRAKCVYRPIQAADDGVGGHEPITLRQMRLGQRASCDSCVSERCGRTQL